MNIASWHRFSAPTSHSPFGGGSHGWPPTVRLGVGDLHCYPSSRIAYAPRTPVSPVRRAGHLSSRPLGVAVAEPEGQSLASKERGQCRTGDTAADVLQHGYVEDRLHARCLPPQDVPELDIHEVGARPVLHPLGHSQTRAT